MLILIIFIIENSFDSNNVIKIIKIIEASIFNDFRN